MDYILYFAYVYLFLCATSYLKIAVNFKMLSRTIAAGGYNDAVRHTTLLCIVFIGIPAVLYNTVVRICTLEIFSRKYWHKTDDEYRVLEKELRGDILELAQMISRYVGK